MKNMKTLYYKKYLYYKKKCSIILNCSINGDDHRYMKKSIQKRIESALLVVLPKGIKLLVNKNADDSYSIKLARRSIKVSWAQNGWLSQIKSVVSQKPDLVVAGKITAEGADYLAGKNIGWVDETGAAEIALDNIIVSRSGRITPDRRPQDKWTQSAVAAAEVILSGHKVTVEEIHKVSGYSWGSCMNALKFLQNEGLLTATAERGRDSARKVENKKKLLAAYTEARINKKPTIELVVGVVWNDPVMGLERLGKVFDNNGTAWAATGMLASAILAPIITEFGSYQVYVEAKDMTDLELIAKNANLKPLKGGRLTLVGYPKDLKGLVLYKNGIRVAPWPRVYADLMTTGVRGEEAAEHLEEVMSEKGR